MTDTVPGSGIMVMGVARVRFVLGEGRKETSRPV